MSDGTHLRPRIWHSSRDAYHCAFRILRLLSAADAHKFHLERLRALDLLLLFPQLLHRMSMTRGIRLKFQEARVKTPNEIFVRLPSTTAVYDDLLLYQNAALGHLTARGILAPDCLRDQIAQLRIKSVPGELAQEIEKRNAQQASLIEFLVRTLAPIPVGGSDGLLRRLGLPGKQVAI